MLFILISPYSYAADILDVYNRSLKFNNDLKIISEFANKFGVLKGNGKIEPDKSEKKMRKFFRKSIYAKLKISKGERFTEKNIVCRRPQNSIKSENYFKIIKKRSNKDILIDQPIYQNDIK